LNRPRHAVFRRKRQRIHPLLRPNRLQMVKEFGKVAGLAWLTLTNSGSFTETVINAANYLPGEGFAREGQVPRGVLGKAGFLADSLANGMIIAGYVHEKAMQRDGDICSPVTFLSPMMLSFLEANIGGTAADLYRLNQTYLGIGGIAAAGVVSGLGTGLGEIASDGRARSSSPCSILPERRLRAMLSVK